MILFTSKISVQQDATDKYQSISKKPICAGLCVAKLHEVVA